MRRLPAQLGPIWPGARDINIIILQMIYTSKRARALLPAGGISRPPPPPGIHSNSLSLSPTSSSYFATRPPLVALQSAVAQFEAPLSHRFSSAGAALNLHEQIWASFGSGGGASQVQPLLARRRRRFSSSTIFAKPNWWPGALRCAVQALALAATLARNQSALAHRSMRRRRRRRRRPRSNPLSGARKWKTSKASDLRGANPLI